MVQTEKNLGFAGLAIRQIRVIYEDAFGPSRKEMLVVSNGWLLRHIARASTIRLSSNDNHKRTAIELW